MKRNYLLLFMFSLLFAASLNAQNGQKPRSIVGIDENLGGYLPMDTKFTNDLGKEVTLKELINKPTILMFVYYECPGLCTPLMSEVADKVSKLGLEPGKDYQIVSLSFNPEEKYQLAADKKKNYLNAIQRQFPDDAWTFLTGDSAAIEQVTDAAGFRYKREGDAWVHAGALIMIAPDGKITRYLLGTEFLPFDMKMGIIEASKGKATPSIANVLKFCFKYDPAGKRYALNVTRVFGGLIIMGAGVFAIVFLRVKKKKDDTVQKS